MRTPLEFPQALKVARQEGAAVRNVDEWVSCLTDALSSARLIDAYNLAVQALEAFPDDLKIRTLAARSLIACDALDEAKHILAQTVVDPAEIRNSIAQSIERLNRILKRTAAQVDLHRSSELAAEWSSRELALADSPDVEAIGALARVHKALWERSGDLAELSHSYELYDFGFERTGSIWLGVNAASLARVLGNRQRSDQLAYQTLLQVELCPDELDHWNHATRGEAFVLLGQFDRALEAYRKVQRSPKSGYAPLASMRRQLRMLERNGVTIPSSIWEALKSPGVVAFTGHRIDEPERPVPRFPESREAEVAERIARILDQTNAQVGYVGAACGADIIFIEQLVERKGEVHIFMPFEREDFVSQSVSYAGPKWRRRFEMALGVAQSVTYITEEPSLGADLFRLLGQVIVGAAELRARALETSAQLVAVCDMIDRGLEGSPMEIIKAWPDTDRRHIISLGQSDSVQTAVRKAESGESRAQGARRVRTFLFADVCGYSRLQEHMQPLFIHNFMERLANHVGRPEFVNTGGDSLFISMECATKLAHFALEMLEFVSSEDWRAQGLEAGLAMRIALHVGPAYELEDPFTGKMNLYGSHVNRAARMEPVAIPGHIYASETFVALLTAEEMQSGVPSSVLKKYLGTIQLPKNFGKESVYCLSRLLESRRDAMDAYQRTQSVGGIDSR